MEIYRQMEDGTYDQFGPSFLVVAACGVLSIFTKTVLSVRCMSTATLVKSWIVSSHFASHLATEAV
eukprot:6470654-Amphidinium_carterae.1